MGERVRYVRKVLVGVAISICSTIVSADQPTDFMGLAVGQGLDFPECAWDYDIDGAKKYKIEARQAVRPCWKYRYSFEGYPGDPLKLEEVMDLNFLPADIKSPDGIDLDGTSVTLVDGRVEVIRTGIVRTEYDQPLLDLLIEKYGQPVRSIETPRGRYTVSSPTIEVFTWRRHDSTVNFIGQESAHISIASHKYVKYLKRKVEENSKKTF